MSMHAKQVLATICCAGLAATSVPASAGDLSLFIGKWILNPKKSKFEPGPAPESMRILTTDADNGKVTSDIERVAADGTLIKEVTTYASDGMEYVPSVMLPPVDPPITFVIRQTDPRIIRIETRSRSKTLSTIATISDDGQTQTGVTMGETLDGKPMKNVMVFEKK